VTQVLSSPLTLCSLLLSAWAVIGFAGLIRPASVALAGRTLFPLGALCGATLAYVAATSLFAPAEQVVLLIGLPDLPVHLRLDGLSSAFLFLLGAAATGISIFLCMIIISVNHTNSSRFSDEMPRY